MERADLEAIILVDMKAVKVSLYQEAEMLADTLLRLAADLRETEDTFEVGMRVNGLGVIQTKGASINAKCGQLRALSRVYNALEDK